jgi:beta-mannosidase
MTISNNGINEKMKYMKTSMEIDSCWSLRNADKREGRETVPAEVPGDLYSDLLRAGIIDDPYYRDNELAALKLAGNDYVYETCFDVPDEILNRERICLVFDGLDTLAEIRLNGVLLGSADNMHRTWKYDIKECLQSKGNRLSILFRSPTEYIHSRY